MQLSDHSIAKRGWEARSRPALARVAVVIIIVILVVAGIVVAAVALNSTTSPTTSTLALTTSSTTQSTSTTPSSSTSSTSSSTSTSTSSSSAQTTSTSASVTSTSSTSSSSSSSSTSTTSASTSSSSSSTGSVTIVQGSTTSVTSTSTSATEVGEYASIFLASTGQGSPSYNTTAGEYGESMAASGPFLLVGAPNETSGGDVGAGNAYLYNATTGDLLQTFTSPSPQKLGSFGWFVALSGDLAIVGAPGQSVNGMTGAGSAYIFSATTGKLLETLTSPNAQSGGQFGGVLATSGSLLVVTAVGENATAGFAGRAYVYNATTGSLLGTLQSPNPEFEGAFGSTAYATPQYVIVAAQNETVGGAVGSGRVYVYDASTLSLVETLVSPNPQDNGEFGFSLAATGSALVVGAPFEAVDGSPDVGNVYIFSMPSWSLSQTLSGSTAAQSMPPNFGASVVAGDGYIAVGAPYNGTEVTQTVITGGAVYLYNATTFASISGFPAPSESGVNYYSSTFGYSLAIGPGRLYVGDPSAVELINTSPGYRFPGDAFIFELT